LQALCFIYLNNWQYISFVPRWAKKSKA